MKRGTERQRNTRRPRSDGCEQSWIIQDEQRWRRAHEIAQSNPGVDVGGIYRVIRNLEKSPSERLRAALHHGRLFRTHGR